MTTTQAQQALHQVPVTTLKGVGARLAETLGKLDIHNLQDLLLHLPQRYQDRTRITPIGGVAPGAEVVIEGEVRGADIVYGRRRSLVCRLQDNTGTITLRFFHFTAAQKARLATGTRVRCFGEARRGSSGLELYHPESQVCDSELPQLAASLTPVYPLTEGITQQRLRALIEQALGYLESHPPARLLPDTLLPAPLRLELGVALRYLHTPPTNVDLAALAEGEHPCQQRLAIEELLAHHLSLVALRLRAQSHDAIPLPQAPPLQAEFLAQLPFGLTGAQQQVATEIGADLARSQPMMRLVQGDVGSGKTVVAALAAMQAVAQGYQVAIMAPTEILAGQHLQNFRAWLAPLGIHTGWLSGSQKVAERRAQLAAIASGEAQVVVGTHALFQDGVDYHNLALVIIDEQHRFGVRQRLALGRKGSGGSMPHQLIMTATPIPRTLAMSAYADLDCSIIDELPPGRQPVNTVAIDASRREQVIERVRAAVREGRQAYWVCTLIEESEALEAQAAEVTATELAELLPELRIGLVHGRLPQAEKDRVMAAFKGAELDLLVATTVIEVGVDVPNASLMIIENPERLGLAQLHQLRGRVGRGSTASHCVLLYSTPLSMNGKARIAAMRQYSDGFAIAEEDLRLRGPGEILGTRQTGDLQYKIADLQRDAGLLPLVQRMAASSELAAPARALLVERWLQRREQFGQV
ncbi:ATP-dependent DNA helicase RecG [Biformimicrobium ophioploci]|uniref:ATP-dependent DNA helicase RecG n=1 Tax=Biformimicrobium ophioploci TaxID=3036711 RepID=A0ABQ6LVH4_9GAMM|nr:ATP-dependent DNA helicase RecG [Microbulbifer sp. NKW57]GMG86103.1 ATP-dependent DNA helicase RecG [Microbulbifer sp. NKW57]